VSGRVIFNRFRGDLSAGRCSLCIIETLATAHYAAVQMIDTSIARVHQHGACITRYQRQSMGRSRGNALRQACLQLPCLRPTCINQAMAAR